MRLFNFKHLHEAGDWFNFKVKPNKRLRVCLSISEAEPEPAQESERRAPDCHFSTLPLIKYHWSAFAALQRRNGRKGKLHPNHWTQKQNKRQGISLDSTQPPKEREISVLVLCFNVRFKGKRQREDQRENLLKQFQKFLGDCCWFYYIIFSSLCTQGSFFFFLTCSGALTAVRHRCVHTAPCWPRGKYTHCATFAWCLNMDTTWTIYDQNISENSYLSITLHSAEELWRS